MNMSDMTQALKTALLKVGPTVYHGWAYKAKDPYIVWLETGGSGLKANGKTQEQAISGTVHLFEQADTAESFFSGVQSALNEAECAWTLNNIQHEQETGLVHYEWTWEVC